jgi:hypothetical protein
LSRKFFLSLSLMFCGWLPVPGSAQSFDLFNSAALMTPVADIGNGTLTSSADAAANRAPKAIALIHVEGTLPHQGIYDQSLESLKDMEAILDLATAYHLTQKESYLKACQNYYDAWLSVYHPNFNPIDETRFDSFILGYDLVGSKLDPGTQSEMKAFLRELAQGYLEGRNITMEGTRTNNWQSHRVKLAALAAFTLGDPDLISWAKQAFQKQLEVNLNADGSTIDFAERDAIHYTVYDLEPLALTAMAAKAHGQDWYHLSNSKGASLQKALEWLSPFAEGKQSHTEFVHSTVAFDAKRREAGLKGFSGTWDPKTSGLLYNFAARLDGRWTPLAKKLGGAPEWLQCLVPFDETGK